MFSHRSVEENASGCQGGVGAVELMVLTPVFFCCWIFAFFLQYFGFFLVYIALSFFLWFDYVVHDMRAIDSGVAQISEVCLVPWFFCDTFAAVYWHGFFLVFMWSVDIFLSGFIAVL